MSNAEESLATLIKWERLPEPSREYVFSERKWRFDFAWWQQKVAVEVEGGHWIGGHSGKRFEQDCVKYNEAALRGWRVLRVTPAMVSDGRAIQTIKRALAEAAAPLRAVHQPGVERVMDEIEQQAGVGGLIGLSVVRRILEGKSRG